jgi:hypothetical protein
MDANELTISQALTHTFLSAQLFENNDISYLMYSTVRGVWEDR